MASIRQRRHRLPEDGEKKNDKSCNNRNDKNHITEAADAASAAIDIHNHLLPLPLVLAVLVCSGFFWVASLRDVMATGKPILDKFGILWRQDDADANYLQYTKSTGLSAIMGVTTDANNMGGLFLRKMAGVAALTFHTSKLWPVLFSSGLTYDRKESAASGIHRWVGASWSAGHFDPILALGMIGDVCLSVFYFERLEELKNAGAGAIGMAFALAGLAEAFVLGVYLLNRRMDCKYRGTPKNISAGASNVSKDIRAEDPNSLPSRIVARTVFITSLLISFISLRDLFLPGTILSFLPRDDIYLEWTGAFLHSPPPDTVEADEHGLEAPLFEGDTFVSQLLGLYLSLGCMLKMMSAVGWSKGNRNMGMETSKSGGKEIMVENVDRSGVVSSRMIWKAMAVGDGLLLFMLRLFTPAAMTASLDLRWHLMFLAYEAFILALYGFW